jgi:hypothetical protein
MVSFEKWLEEIVCWNNTEYLSRQQAIWRFVSRGIVPFFIEHGYMIFNKNELASGIANLLYDKRGLSCMEGPYYPTESYVDEHKNRYYHVLGDEWEAFWSSWGLWTDMTSSRGEDRRIDIQEYCWTHIDLEKSPQTRVVEEFMEDEPVKAEDFKDPEPEWTKH